MEAVQCRGAQQCAPKASDERGSFVAKVDGIRIDGHGSSEDVARGWDVFDVHFTPSPVNSRPQEVCLLLENAGKLQVNFNVKFPNDSDVEVEPWADPGEPTPDELMRANILDSRLFEVQPRSGSLGAGEALTLKVSYKYTMLEYDGVHVLPVELALENGKHVILRLKGRTLAHNQPLLFSGGRNDVRLADVPIGCSDPCSQTFEVQNTSAVDVDVRIDKSNLEAVVEENYGFPVIRCTNDARWITVPAFRSFNLAFVFHPIEAKPHDGIVAVEYGPAASSNSDDAELQRIELRVRGSGFVPNVAPNATRGAYGEPWSLKSTHAAGLPQTQLLGLSNQLGSFAVDSIIFGAVQRGALIRRFTVLRNLSGHHLRFTFDEENDFLRDNVIQISPVSGTLAPGAVCAMKVVLRADEVLSPKILQSSIACFLTTCGGSDGPGGGTRVGTKQSIRVRSVSRASSSAAKKRHLKRVDSRSHQSVVERSTASRDNRLREAALMRQLKSGGGQTGGLASAGSADDFLSSMGDYPMSPAASASHMESCLESVAGGMSRALTASPASGIAPFLQLPTLFATVLRL